MNMNNNWEERFDKFVDCYEIVSDIKIEGTKLNFNIKWDSLKDFIRQERTALLEGMREEILSCKIPNEKVSHEA